MQDVPGFPFGPGSARRVDPAAEAERLAEARRPGFRLITDTGGTRHLVDAGGVRYLTETQPGHWELAVRSGNWPAITQFAKAVLATPDPGAA